MNKEAKEKLVMQAVEKLFSVGLGNSKNVLFMLLFYASQSENFDSENVYAIHSLYSFLDSLELIEKLSE